MKGRWIKLPQNHAKAIGWIVAILSVIVIVESAWLIYLKFSKAMKEVRIVEIRTEFKVPEEVGKEFEIEKQFVKVADFDYGKLLMNAATIVGISSPVCVYTLSPEDSLKIIGSCGSYIISEVSSDVYSVATLRECDVGAIPQRMAYGVFTMAVDDIGFAYAKMLSLRDRELPAFLVEYEKDGKIMYSVAVGAFPTRALADEFKASVDWEELWREVGTEKRVYVGCVAGCVSRASKGD